MFDIKKDFYKELIYNDLGQAKKHGCALTTPIIVFPDPLPESELHKLEKQYGIYLNPSLLEFYKQGAYLNMFWKLWDGDSRATVEQFKTDPWLQETYFHNAYPSDNLWRPIREYKLTGSIFISSAEQLLKQDPSDAYAIVLDVMDMDWKEYCLSKYMTKV